MVLETMMPIFQALAKAIAIMVIYFVLQSTKVDLRPHLGVSRRSLVEYRGALKLL